MRSTALALLLLAGCASDAPQQVEFDSSAGVVTIGVGGDGFVLEDGERMPWEAAVLDLRQRTRGMDAEQRRHFAVHLRIDTPAGDADAEARAIRDRNRLIDQLDIMDVAYVKNL